MKQQVITQTQDLTMLSWAKARQSSGTAGSFLKSYDDLGGVKTYYKLSDYDAMHGIVGHECINEIVADRLLTILGIDHLHYQLIHADIVVDGKVRNTWLNASQDFKKPGEGKVALDTYYELERADSESPLDFCLRMGWHQQAWESLVVDFLILNRDRHGANLEVIRNPQAHTLRLAPLFDHGLSFMFRTRNDVEVAGFDVLADLPVQNYFGGSSAWENLQLIPTGELPLLNALKESDQSGIFDGLEQATTPLWRQRVWEMIWQRWCRYEAFCDERRQ